ncbi:MAG: cupin domain-containing protein [Armatimonadota bacterium]
MRKIHITDGKRYTFATHINDMLLPREEAEVMEAFRVVIEPGKYTHQHAHADTEQLYYVISGAGRADLVHPDGARKAFALLPGDVVHVPRGAEHQIFCAGDEDLVYLCVDGFPLGKPADEPTWDDHYAAVIAMQQASR